MKSLVKKVKPFWKIRMIRISYLWISFLFLSSLAFSQSTEILGKVTAPSDVDRIHIINKTANRFTVTNDDGQFEINASLNDTLRVGAIQYKPVEIVINDSHIASKYIAITLSEKITELDEVVVGKVLTGDLLSDIENSDAKRDINFYDLGIPGYTGKRHSQSERRLHDAVNGGGLVPINPLLNWISGRTKKLKLQLERERLDDAMDSAASRFSELLFEIENLEESKRTQFYYFVADDPEFLRINNLNNDLEMFEFLQQKLKAFKVQLEEN